MKKKKRPLIIGEVLYDKFEGKEEKYLGGAPFNVAWTLRGFGYDPLFVSRVGTDVEGEGVLRAMESWGMDTSGIQIDNKRSTGLVEIRVEGEENRYEILEEMAYDHIEVGAVLDYVKGSEDIGLIYHGTLLSRGEKSWGTLLELKEASKLPVFVDLNLREPYYDDVVLDRVLSGARWIKLNIEELDKALKVGGGAFEYEHERGDFLTKIKEGIIKLESKYNGLGVVGVTAGGRGAVLSNREIIGHKVPRKLSVADTVGAGDGFSSMMLMGLMEGISCAIILDMAVEFSSKVCGIKGATINEERFYKDFAFKWGIK